MVPAEANFQRTPATGHFDRLSGGVILLRATINSPRTTSHSSSLRQSDCRFALISLRPPASNLCARPTIGASVQPGSTERLGIWPLVSGFCRPPADGARGRGIDGSEKSQERLAQRNGYRDRSWETPAPAPSSLGDNYCSRSYLGGRLLWPCANSDRAVTPAAIHPDRSTARPVTRPLGQLATDQILHRQVS
jgi:hypothetical protein